MNHKSYRSDPLRYSTAGDFLPDGWKHPHGLNVTNNVAGLDPDGDGLTNFDEYCHGADPRNADTDGDGVPDGIEIPHSPGSDPSDPDDDGDPANCVTVKLTVGDPSGSLSERWEMHVINTTTGHTRRHLDQSFGAPGTAEYSLVRGRSYRIKLRWVASNLASPDYDWCCLINGLPSSGVRPALYGTGVTVVEDPDHLLTTLTEGNDNNIALWREALIHVPKFTFVEPAGNPVAEPKDVGIGQNQFTFSTATPGILGITLKVKVEPPEVTELVAEHCEFTVGSVGSSVKAWASGTPNGMPLAVGDWLLAEVSFSNLPDNNDAFGWKTAILECAGIILATNRYGVFFKSDAVDHPPCATCPGCPNCFYYWKQGNVCGIPVTCVFNVNYEEYGYTNPELDSVIRLGRQFATINNPHTYTSLFPNYGDNGSITVGGNGTGIVCVTQVIQHEMEHLNIYQQFNHLYNNVDDFDGDEIPNTHEATYGGIETDATNCDTFRVGFNPTTGIYKRVPYGDSEIRCRRKEELLTIPVFPEKDWANPGCQHKNQWGPRPQTNP